MKKFWIFWIIWCFLLANLFSQESSSKIEKLVGGHFVFNGQLASTSISVLHYGRSTPSNKYLAWMDFYQNPAFSTGIKRPFLVYSFAPAITLRPDHLIDLNGRVRRAIDSGVTDYRADSLTLSYPTMKTTLQNNRLWGQGLISFPAGGAVFTFGYQNQFSIHLKTLVTGMETTISTEVPMSETTSKVVLNAFLDATGRIDLQIDRATVGVAKVIRNRFAFGFSLDRFGATVKANGFADTQGDMLFNGHEYIFNNPNDNWHNTLTQSILGGYKGSGWRMNWGGWYVLNRNFLLEGVISVQTPLKLQGRLILQLNKIPALNVSALSSNDPNAEILDPAGLDLARLTLTDSVQNPVYDILWIHEESRFKIGLLYQRAHLYWYNSTAFNFNYNGLAYGPYKIGLRSHFNWHSLLGWRHFYVDAKISRIHTFVRHSPKLGAQEKHMWLPSLALGYARIFWKHYSLQIGTSILPDPIVYCSTGYQF